MTMSEISSLATFAFFSRQSSHFFFFFFFFPSRFVREITTMIESLKHDVEVLSAKDGIDGLVLLKTHGVDVRLCLADMVMPGCSGIELLNRARADPALLHVTFALMTESSSGKDGKKSLSHFQVSDDRGEPVSVLIKPLHSALVDDMLQRLNQTPEETAVQRKHSNASLLNAGLEADPDWSRTRSRSDWGKRSDMPKSSPSGSESSSPRSGLSPGRESPSAQAGLTLSAPSPGTGSGEGNRNEGIFFFKTCFPSFVQAPIRQTPLLTTVGCVRLACLPHWIPLQLVAHLGRLLGEDLARFLAPQGAVCWQTQTPRTRVEAVVTFQSCSAKSPTQCRLTRARKRWKRSLQVLQTPLQLETVTCLEACPRFTFRTRFVQGGNL
jgi:CheY-like chemotaxis protein